MTARYAITAQAACCALGMTRAQVLSRLYAGETGLRATEFARADGSAMISTALGALPDKLPALPARLSAFDSRLARMAGLLVEPLTAAVASALRRYGATRVGIVVASSTAGLAETEVAYGAQRATGVLPASYHFDQSHAFHALVSVLRMLTGVRGPGYVVSTACASSNKVFASAQRLLHAGFVDAVLVGGIDTLCQTTVRGFHGLGILSKQPCRPFARDRDGTSIGEGGALLLIERGHDAAALLCGTGEGCDAHHMTQPPADGAGAQRALHAALQDAGLAATDVDHVNAHGTGTPLNDVSEARALATIFGPELPVVSTKGATGHMLGAAAAIEAVFAIAAIERGQIPPSLGSDPRDPDVSLRIDPQSRSQVCRYVVSNAFAFGGSNACVIFGAGS